MSEVCGLGIEGEIPGQPLAALVVVKCLSEDGEVGVSYSVRATPGLSATEALGMAGLADVRLREALARPGP